MQPTPRVVPAAPLPIAATPQPEVDQSSIPALVEAAKGSGGPLPPRPVRSDPLPPSAPALNASAPDKAKVRTRPDAKPMRIVYGTGALAAVSVMTVGMVQPDFNGSADTELAPPAQQDSLAGTDASTSETDGRRVVRYVFLRPGDEAPAGARVITEAEAAERGVAVPERRRATRNRPNRPSRRPVIQAQPEVPRAARPPAAQPQPRPDPPVRTHQSGRG